MVPMEAILRSTPQRVLPPVGIVGQRQWGPVEMEAALDKVLAQGLAGILEMVAMVVLRIPVVGLLGLLEAVALAAAAAVTSCSTILPWSDKKKFSVALAAAALAFLALAPTERAGGPVAVV